MTNKRERIVERVRLRLLRKGQPRLIVSLLLLVTGLAGFLVSFALLHSGMTRMWLRYPLSILFAYCVFLLLLRLWLSYQRPRAESDLDIELEDFSPPELSSPDMDFPNPAGRSGGFADNFRFSGGGGDAGGGGGGGSWGQSLTSSPSSSTAASGRGASSGGSSSRGSGGGGLDLDEGALIVVAIVAVAGALVAVFYVIYAAPLLLAEVLVDGVLMTGLYRKLKGIEQRHWLRAAVRRTLAPALIAALLFSLAGYALQKAAPKARSVGEVWKYVRED